MFPLGAIPKLRARHVRALVAAGQKFSDRSIWITRHLRKYTYYGYELLKEIQFHHADAEIFTSEPTLNDKGRDSMRVLILCHHLSTWAGSEMVSMELLEALNDRGHFVNIRCAFPSARFVHRAISDWGVLEIDPKNSDLGSFDLAIVLH
ncbi:hypothetical protein [Breoghania sp.]|uniref:hypothetical protein n=1 Tax=Breoghania sp. TaxID=2065378 RepID=UPI002622DE3D|nr:hypothetical protein [Breoghania sp.]MDJ0930609.1 hypothetical protein [Breoghania sp.]